ncbi:50S ribosomal protein L21e [Candidatus Woesearchaeota archaeon]|nr:50S ribosomal protein L21e [Candidatus Woesearchaeota archaeon]
MVRRKGGLRKKTRHLMRKNKKDRGKLSLTRFFAEYEVGDKVKLLADPTYQKGMFFLRYHGKNAIVQHRRGNCYEVSIRDGGKIKTLISHPIHLRKL